MSQEWLQRALGPFKDGQVPKLRTMVAAMVAGKATAEDLQLIRAAVMVLLDDRAKWDQLITEETQERMRFLVANQADLPMEALQWIVTTNREGTPE